MAVITPAPVNVSNVSVTKLFDPPAYKADVIVQNLGANPIYVGDSAVATTTGLQIAANGTLTFSDVTSPLYALAATAAQSSPSNTRVMLIPRN